MSRLRESLWRLLPAVRSGERPRFAFFFALSAVLTAAQTLGLAGSEALFLAHPGLGPGRLPHAFVAASVATVLASGAYGAAVGRVRNDRLFVVLLLAAAVGLGAAALSIRPAGAPAIAAAFCAFYVLQAVLAISHFQTFAADYFDTLASKRVFPLFAVGASLGGAAGGAAALGLSSAVAPQGLLVAWALLLALAGGGIALARGALLRWAPLDREELDESSVENLRSGLRFAAGSALARWLIVAVVGMVFASLLLQYLYLEVFARRFASAAALSAFFGAYLAASNLFEIAVGNLATPWLIRRFGIAQANLAHPLLTLVAFAAMVVDPRLPAAVLGRLTRESLENALAAPLRALAYNGLPFRFRGRMRVLLEGIVTFAAMSLAGACLLALAGRLRFEWVAAVGATAALVYAAACWRVRDAYLEGLVDAVRSGRLDRDVVRERLGDADVAELAVAWETVLDEETGPVGAPMLELADWLARRGHYESLRRLAAHPQAGVRRACLAALAAHAPARDADFWTVCLDDPDLEVRRCAARALADRAPLEPDLAAELEERDGDGDPVVRADLALARGEGGWERLLAMTASPDPDGAAAALARLPAALAARAVERLADPEPRIRAAALTGAVASSVAAGATRDALRDAHPEVRRAAARALAARGRTDLAPALAEALDDPVRAVRSAAAEALRALGGAGAAAATPWLDGQRQWTVEAALRAMSGGGAAGRTRLQAAFERRVDELWHHLQALRSHRDDGSLPARFLAAALGNGLVRSTSLVFRILEHLEDAAVVRSVQKTLAQPPSRARADALEVLTHLGPRDASQRLAALLEEGALQDRLRGQPESRDLSPAEVLAWARSVDDPWLRLAADAVDPETGHPDREETAHMEGLLALRRVPFFSRLSLEQLEAVSRVMTETSFVEGECLMREGETGEDLYVLLEGECEFWKAWDTPRAQRLNRMVPVDCIGEMAVLDQAPRSVTVVCTRDARLLRLEGARFRELILETPEIAFDVFRTLTERVRAAEGRLAAGETG